MLTRLMLACVLLAGCSQLPGRGHGCPTLEREPRSHLTTLDVRTGAVLSSTGRDYVPVWEPDAPEAVSPFGTVDPPVPLPAVRTPHELVRHYLVVHPPGNRDWQVRSVLEPVVTEAAGVLVYTQRPGQLRGSRVSDGLPLWNLRKQGISFGTVLAVEGRSALATGAVAGRAKGAQLLVRFDLVTGVIAWQQELGAPRRRLLATGDLVVSATAPDYGPGRITVFVNNSVTGRLLWRHAVPLTALGGLAVRDDELLVGTSDYVVGCM